MVRLIKRYESRKLYDTEESRYVSLDQIAEWVRQGQEVRVTDNASSDDVTSQTLTQVILEEGRNGRSRIPTELLHELVRFGGRALSSGVEQVQQGVGRVVKASIDRLGPVRQVRQEMNRLRSRLEELEESLVGLEAQGFEPPPAARRARVTKKRGGKKGAAKKTRSRSSAR
ncbi:MAG: polyhydroxyalkanoate synthesis regulator DNA-binding domain-containing protein [Thermoanaerobaculia bacterium]